MKKFENFVQSDKKEIENLVQNDKKELEKLPYIKDFGGTLKIFGTSFNKFTTLKSLNHRFYVDLDYNSLIRLFLASWIDKYNGGEPTLLKIKKELLKNDKRDDNITQYFTKIPTNRTIMNKYISPVIKMSIKTTSDNDPAIMKAIIDNKDVLFTEANILLWYNEIKGINVFSKGAEDEVIKIFNDLGIMNGEVIGATIEEDKLGIDALCGDITIQIKRVGSNCDVKWYWNEKTKDSETKYYFLEIDDLNLDLKNYNSYSDGKLIFDYLVVYDVKGRKIYKIDSKSINSINRWRDKITIKMWNRNMRYFDKNFQIIDLVPFDEAKKFNI